MNRIEMVMDAIEPAVSCFSCDIEFEPKDNNDREEGWFCDDCLDNDK